MKGDSEQQAVGLRLDQKAAVLNRLRIDPARLIYTFRGRQFRPTDVSGEVVRKKIG